MNQWPEASAQLLARAQQSEEGFIELYTMYAQRVLRFLLTKTANEQLAEDLAQETFMSVMRALPQYQDRGKPFSHWLLTIAHNHVRAYFRKQRPENIDDATLAHYMDSEQQTQPATELPLDMVQAMRMLSEQDQQLLHLKYIEDLSNVEIARILGLSSANTCTVRIHRALKRLSKHLKSYDE